MKSGSVLSGCEVDSGWGPVTPTPAGLCFLTRSDPDTLAIVHWWESRGEEKKTGDSHRNTQIKRLE